MEMIAFNKRAVILHTDKDDYALIDTENEKVAEVQDLADSYLKFVYSFEFPNGSEAEKSMEEKAIEIYEDAYVDRSKCEYRIVDQDYIKNKYIVDEIEVDNQCVVFLLNDGSFAYVPITEDSDWVYIIPYRYGIGPWIYLPEVAENDEIAAVDDAESKLQTTAHIKVHWYLQEYTMEQIFKMNDDAVGYLKQHGYWEEIAKNIGM